MFLLCAFLITLISTCISFYYIKRAISPDGKWYKRMGKGELSPQPYTWRWLLPLMCKDKEKRWQVVTFISMAMIGIPLFLYLVGMGLAPAGALFGVALFAGMGFIYHYGARFPVLTDAAGMLLILTSAACFVHGYLIAGVAVAAISLTVRESAPIWIAITAWTWLPLLVLPLFIYSYYRKNIPAPENEPWLTEPRKFALKCHRDSVFDIKVMLLPFGALLLSLLNPGLQLFVAMGVGFGQMYATTDILRLSGFATPVMLVCAVPMVPENWYVFVAVMHFFNPWKLGLDR